MEKINIRPLKNRVVVKPVDSEEKTPSGIYIPDIAKEKPHMGYVVAVGKGNNNESLDVQVGDKVLYGKYSGTELKMSNGDYLIMREDDILAILD